MLIALFCLPHTAGAACDIRPIAQSYFREIVEYTALDSPAPKLVISDAPLVKIGDEKLKEYGKHTAKSKGLMASQFDPDTDTITIYAKVFADHPTCDVFVRNKTKRYVVHEYTHYADFHYPLSEAVHAKNLETTAIMGEHILPKLVWGKRNPRVIRNLSREEKWHARALKEFFVQHHVNR